MFYRRKIILSLLQLFEGKLSKIRLQKLLFLFTQKQSKAEYDFVPYKFGCYSFSANADLTTMVKRNMLTEDKDSFKRTDKKNYFSELKPEDKYNLLQLKNAFGNMSTKALMKYVYLNYPFYAINSEASERILNELDLQRVNDSKPKGIDTILFTIGYEGISLEEYLIRLIKNDVKVLVDVRRNPISMKYGFSKSRLKNYCESLGIIYIHFPEMGIQSEYRRELNTQEDYDKLFSAYRKQTLINTEKTQTDILNLLKKYKRIALTCFEANIDQCHRKHLADSIKEQKDLSYSIEHI